MVRVIAFFLLILLLGLGFAWLAERPGDLVITFGGYRYELTLVTAAVLVVAAVAAAMILWWLIRGIWRSPHSVARYFRARRRDRGYQSLSTGLIAAGAGDSGLARRMGKQAAKLISSDQEPLLHLLDAQAALLDGDREQARKIFSQMLEDPELRLLGLRGLYLEAERAGEREAARHYAAQAADAAPQLGWAMTATLEARTEEHDWNGALALLEAQKPPHPRTTRLRAVLLTAHAMEELDVDPAMARANAMEALRLQPDFVPAAVTAARALLRQNDLRRATKVLETIWKQEPHPEVAETYVHARPGDTTKDRLSRARRLARLRPNHVESELAVARAALAAGEFAEARAAAEAAVRLSPREGAFLLLADIEEAETGDEGRVRYWLSKAVRAPRDPAWVADGYVSDRWMPASPVTGELDAFEWRAPMERLGQLIDGEEELKALPPKQAQHIGEDGTDEAHHHRTEEIEADLKELAVEGELAKEEAASIDTEDLPRAGSSSLEEPASAQPVNADELDQASKEIAAARGELVGVPDKERSAPPLPDDPGVDAKKTEAADVARRFRLF